VNAPLSHAAGRLFDSFSAALGFAPAKVSYEGQAAIRLETAARSAAGGATPQLSFTTREKDGLLLIDWQKSFALLSDRDLSPGSLAKLALAVHYAVADAAVTMLEYGISQGGISPVVLSGGVFMNRILSELVVTRLQARGIDLRLPRQVPPNDGGIAFGQAVVAGLCPDK
jgi:hydrogenase maturation protein HypF